MSTNTAVSILAVFAMFGVWSMALPIAKYVLRAVRGARKALTTARALTAYLRQRYSTTPMLPMPAEGDTAGTFAVADMVLKRLPWDAQVAVMAHLIEKHNERYQLIRAARLAKN